MEFKLYIHGLRYYLLLFIGLIILNDLSGQILIKGTLIDENCYEMPGASILELNSSNGLISDVEGKFTILVSDTSMIQISFVGYYDTIIIASDFVGDTIQMRAQPYDSVDIWVTHYDYFNTMNIGYYGDINRLPYGFTFYYFKPYLFGKPLMINTNLTFKTDFNSNFDFKVRFGKSEIIRKEKYRLSSTFYIHLRDLTIDDTKYRINDYEFLIRNCFFNFLHLSGGLLIRDEFSNAVKYGGLIAIDASISKTLSHLSFDLVHIDNDYEYSVALYQRLARNTRVLRDFQFGIEYQDYLDYNEINLIMRYTLR
jgi:hypothetical protein